MDPAPTALAVTALAALGYDDKDPAVKRGVDALAADAGPLRPLESQRADWLCHHGLHAARAVAALSREAAGAARKRLRLRKRESPRRYGGALPCTWLSSGLTLRTSASSISCCPARTTRARRSGTGRRSRSGALHDERGIAGAGAGTRRSGKDGARGGAVGHASDAARRQGLGLRSSAVPRRGRPDTRGSGGRAHHACRWCVVAHRSRLPRVSATRLHA